MGNAARDANNTATLLGISSVDGITPIPIRVDPITGAIMCKIISGNQFSPLTTKGDIYTYSTTQDRLGVGSNGQILVADSSTATGLRWATAGAGSGDVVGPASSVDGEIPLFSGVTGKLLKRGTVAGTLTLNGATGTVLTNPILQLTNSINGFTQVSIQNKSAGVSASSDMIVYPDNNTNDTTGFTDMGVASSGFADAAYALTTPNDSYLFGSCVSGSGKLGNLVIATDSTGTTNNIIFGIGGFTSLNKERMRITNTGITIGYQSIASGTIALYNSGNAFNTSIVQGTIAANTVITLPGATDTLIGRATVDTFTGAKTFNDTKIGLRNVANTFTGLFTNTITAARTWTLPDATDTLVGKATTDIFTNKSLSDSTTFFVDVADNTKKVWIDVTGTTGITGILQTAFTTAKTIAFPDLAGTVALTTNNLSIFAATTSLQLLGVISDETGSGSLVFATSPTLVTPLLGTPTSGILTNCTGLPVATGISGLATGMATFLATPSSANLATTITDETGTGSLVFGTNPTLTKPALNGSNPTGATYSPGSGAQTVALDAVSNNIHVVTGNAAGTAMTFTIANMTNDQIIIVSILQGAVVSTISGWFATVRWAGGTTPTLTATVGKRDTFAFKRTGANTYDGFIIGQNC